MFCPRCGTQIPDTARFCGNCRAKIPEKAVQSVQSQVAAKNAALDQGGQEAAASGGLKYQDYLWLVIAALAVVVAVGALGALNLFSFDTPSSIEVVEVQAPEEEEGSEEGEASEERDGGDEGEAANEEEAPTEGDVAQ